MIKHRPALVRSPGGVFAAVREQFAAAGVRVPGLLGADLDRGYLLLEDPGDAPLLPALSPATIG